jgi:hypothetical protein
MRLIRVYGAIMTMSTTARTTQTRIMNMDMTAATDTMTSDMAHANPIAPHPIPATARYTRTMPWGKTARALFIMGTLLLTPILLAHADENRATEAPASNHNNAFGEAVKREARAVGATFKEGAHRVKVASKAVAHEIATAAKRGAAETRAAFRGETVNTPAT